MIYLPAGPRPDTVDAMLSHPPQPIIVPALVRHSLLHAECALAHRGLRWRIVNATGRTPITSKPFGVCGLRHVIPNPPVTGQSRAAGSRTRYRAVVDLMIGPAPIVP